MGREGEHIIYYSSCMLTMQNFEVLALLILFDLKFLFLGIFCACDFAVLFVGAFFIFFFFGGGWGGQAAEVLGWLVWGFVSVFFKSS